MRKSLLFGILLLIEIIVILSLSFIAKDSIVIDIGIRGYYRLIHLMIFVLVLTIISNIVFYFCASLKKKREKQSLIQAEALKEEEQLKESSLSVKHKLDNYELRNILQENSMGEWNCLSDDVNQLVSQLHDMDAEQERLRVLLKHNAADVLSDTEAVLERSEQYMCRNVRKVINYMSVYHSDSDADVKALQQEVLECQKLNGALLSEVHEFLLMLTEFLNKQGDNSYDGHMLETYKETLLAMIGKE